jgi:HK97 family phage major capsid protein
MNPRIDQLWEKQRVIQARADAEKRDLNQQELAEVNRILDEIETFSARTGGQVASRTFTDHNECLRAMGKAFNEAKSLREKGDKMAYTEAANEFDDLAGELRSKFGLSAPTFSEEGFRKVAHWIDLPDRAPGRMPEPRGKFEGNCDAGDFSFRTNPDGSSLRHAFNRYLLSGPHSISEKEYRALQSDSSTAGGYLNAPEQFVRELLKGLDNELFMMRLCRTIPVPGADSLGIPELANSMADADWTSELATGAEDTDMSFGKRELHPHPLAKRIRVSNKLLRVSALDPEAIVRDQMLYKFFVALEQAFMIGSGSGQPLGIFFPSSQGITTARDVSTGNTQTSITADGLIEAEASLKSQYLRNAQWIFSRTAIKQIRQLKDGEGQYLWVAGLGGTPNTILGHPYYISEYCPNTFTSGKYVGILGDFRFYWVAIALSMAVQRLVELYAESNQTGFIGRMELDGMPVLSEAFARVKLA